MLLYSLELSWLQVFDRLIWAFGISGVLANELSQETSAAVAPSMREENRLVVQR
jgi:hypothetical protein